MTKTTTFVGKQRLRKLLEDDRRILGEVIRDCGRPTVVLQFLLMGAVKLREAQKQRAFKHGVPPLRFMRDILRDYTENAVLQGIKTVPAAKKHRQSVEKA